MVNQAILISTLENIIRDLKKITSQTPSVIIIGDVVNHSTKFKECLDSMPSKMVESIDYFGFDIWKNQAITA